MRATLKFGPRVVVNVACRGAAAYGWMHHTRHQADHPRDDQRPRARIPQAGLLFATGRLRLLSPDHLVGAQATAVVVEYARSEVGESGSLEGMDDGRPKTGYGELTPPPMPSWLSPERPQQPVIDTSVLERLRHCWVNVDEHGRVPALLLEWRRTPSGWEARVVRPVLDLEDEAWRPREEWLPLELLEQA